MATVNEISGNTGINTAQPINVGDTVKGALTVKGGVEVYSITVSAPTVLQITFSTSSSSLSDWTYFIGIENPQFDFIGGTTLGYQQTSSTFDTYLPNAGTYYLIPQDSNTFSTNPYFITTSTNNTLLNHIEPKPSKSISTSNAINLGSGYYGQLISTSDLETYSFNLKSNSAFYLSFNAPNTNLIDSSGTRITSATYQISILDSSGKSIQTIISTETNPSPSIFNSLNSGTYYIQITGHDGYDGNEFNFVANTLSPSNASKLSVGQTINDSITSTSAIKLYSVFLTAGSLYQFSCNANTTSNLTALTNEKLSVLNSNFTEIESNWTTAAVVQIGTNSTTQYLTPSVELIAPYTGLYYISVDSANNAGSFQLTSSQTTLNTLVQDEVWKGNSVYPNAYWATTPNQTLHLTYSFMQTNPNTKEVGFVPMNSAQQSAVINALQMISSVCNIIFTYTSDQNSANILYGTSDQTDSGGNTYTLKSQSNGNFLQEGVFIDNSGTNATANSIATPNGYGFEAILHETGHALGLKHPGEYASGQAITTPDGPFAPAGWDSRSFSVMSYVNNENTDLNHSGLATLDIAALQNLYGVPQNPQVVTFSIPSVNSIVTSTPYAALGSTIDISKETVGSTISMQDGSYSSMGKDSNGNIMHDNVNIPWGSQFTNVIGGTFNDVIYCNNLNDVITLGKTGNDYVYGGSGVDTVVLNEPLKNFNISNSNGTITIKDSTNGYGNETIVGVNRVKFSDVSIAYDVNGSAGNVLLILNAVFGSSYIQNKTYIGIGIYYEDSGMSLSQLSTLALSAAGANTAQQVVNALYTNVVGVQPTSSQALPYLQMLQSGTSFGDLAVLAENSSYNQNHVNLTGLQSIGIQYFPYISS